MRQDLVSPKRGEIQKFGRPSVEPIMVYEQPRDWRPPVIITAMICITLAFYGWLMSETSVKVAEYDLEAKRIELEMVKAERGGWTDEEVATWLIIATIIVGGCGGAVVVLRR